MSEEKKPIQPLISVEMMEKILSSRRSITTEEAYKEVERHTGKPVRPARKAVYRNGRKIWVSC